MIKIALCDDEGKFLEVEKKLIAEYFEDKGMSFSVECYSSGEELLDDDAMLKIADLIILDVEMKGIDGISVAKKIREQNDKVNIAFLSAHMNYSTDGYHVRAVRFILKTMDDIKDYLFECLDCVMTNLNLIDKEVTLDFTIGKRSLKIKNIDISRQDFIILIFKPSYSVLSINHHSRLRIIGYIQFIQMILMPVNLCRTPSRSPTPFRHKSIIIG